MPQSGDQKNPHQFEKKRQIDLAKDSRSQVAPSRGVAARIADSDAGRANEIDRPIPFLAARIADSDARRANEIDRPPHPHLLLLLHR